MAIDRDLEQYKEYSELKKKTKDCFENRQLQLKSKVSEKELYMNSFINHDIDSCIKNSVNSLVKVLKKDPKKLQEVAEKLSLNNATNELRNNPALEKLIKSGVEDFFKSILGVKDLRDRSFHLDMLTVLQMQKEIQTWAVSAKFNQYCLKFKESNNQKQKDVIQELKTKAQANALFSACLLKIQNEKCQSLKRNDEACLLRSSIEKISKSIERTSKRIEFMRENNAATSIGANFSKALQVDPRKASAMPSGFFKKDSKFGKSLDEFQEEITKACQQNEKSEKCKKFLPKELNTDKLSQVETQMALKGQLLVEQVEMIQDKEDLEDFLQRERLLTEEMKKYLEEKELSKIKDEVKRKIKGEKEAIIKKYRQKFAQRTREESLGKNKFNAQALRIKTEVSLAQDELTSVLAFNNIMMGLLDYEDAKSGVSISNPYSAQSEQANSIFDQSHFKNFNLNSSTQSYQLDAQTLINAILGEGI